MWYIFNADNKRAATCNMKPNVEDLATRGEFAVESQENIPFDEVGLDENKKVIRVVREITVEEVKTSKKELLNRQCQSAICSGFYSSALGEPHKYESKQEDQVNLMGAAQIGSDMPYRCWNVEGTKQEWYLHTAAQIKQVFLDGTLMVRANLERVSILKEQVDAAQTVEEIEAIEW